MDNNIYSVIYSNNIMDILSETSHLNDFNHPDLAIIYTFLNNLNYRIKLLENISKIFIYNNKLIKTNPQFRLKYTNETIENQIFSSSSPKDFISSPILLKQFHRTEENNEYVDILEAKSNLLIEFNKNIISLSTFTSDEILIILKYYNDKLILTDNCNNINNNFKKYIYIPIYNSSNNLYFKKNINGYNISDTFNDNTNYYIEDICSYNDDKFVCLKLNVN